MWNSPPGWELFGILDVPEIPRGAAQSPSLEVFQVGLDKSLSNPVLEKDLDLTPPEIPSCLNYPWEFPIPAQLPPPHIHHPNLLHPTNPKTSVPKTSGAWLPFSIPCLVPCDFPSTSRKFGISWIHGHGQCLAFPSGIFQSFADPSQRILGCENVAFAPDPRKTSDQTPLAPPSAISHSFLFFHQNLLPAPGKIHPFPKILHHSPFLP